MFRQAASSLGHSETWLGRFYQRIRSRHGGGVAVAVTVKSGALSPKVAEIVWLAYRGSKV